MIQIISNLHVIQKKRNILLTKRLIDFILLPKFCIPSSNQHTLTQPYSTLRRSFSYLYRYLHVFISVVFVLWMRSSKNLISYMYLCLRTLRCWVTYQYCKYQCQTKISKKKNKNKTTKKKKQQQKTLKHRSSRNNPKCMGEWSSLSLW